MLVVYHGDGAGKESAALGVLFRAHGRGLPVRHVRFDDPRLDDPDGDDLALQKLGIPSDVIGEPGANGADPLWNCAAHHMSAMNEGVIVLEGLLDAVTKGWLSARNVADTFAHDDSLLHIIVTGRKPVPEIVEIADLVSNMRAVKQRDANSPAIAGIDY